MTSNYFIIHMLKFCSGKHFCKKKDQLTINAGKVYGERKKKTIPGKSTSDAATEESSELEKSKDSSA